MRTRLGWVLFDNNVVTPLGDWYNIPASLLHDWKLTHPIMAAEAFAVLAAIWQNRDLLTGRDVIFFIDNEAAASAMIKGDSRLPVVGTMAMCVQLLLIRYKIAIWFQWVDSNSNLADGLSRDGAEDPWTLDQHWPRCKNNSFQSLLNIDQSNYLEYVRKLFCSLGLIAQESEHSFALAFCSVSAVPISPHHIVCSVSQPPCFVFSCASVDSIQSVLVSHQLPLFSHHSSRHIAALFPL